MQSNLRKIDDELVSVGHFGGSINFLLSGVGPSEGDIFGHRTREEGRLLLNDSELATEPCKVQFLQVLTIDENL